MAVKISTIVLKVDFECERCYKKIRRILFKIQHKLGIEAISFDEKSNAVTISGPFDAGKVSRTLWCEAGRVIKKMDVKGKEESKAGPKPSCDKPIPPPGSVPASGYNPGYNGYGGYYVPVNDARQPYYPNAVPECPVVTCEDPDGCVLM